MLNSKEQIIAMEAFALQAKKSADSEDYNLTQEHIIDVRNIARMVKFKLKDEPGFDPAFVDAVIKKCVEIDYPLYERLKRRGNGYNYYDYELKQLRKQEEQAKDEKDKLIIRNERTKVLKGLDADIKIIKDGIIDLIAMLKQAKEES